MNQRRILEHLYLEDKKSIKEIQEITGLRNVSKILQSLGIPLRTAKENFRIFIVGAQKKHRDPNIDYYSDLEKIFEREYLINRFGLTKNKDFFHDRYLPPTKCQADFLIKAINLDIEIDASQWHSHKDHSRRDSRLAAIGIRVIRFNENDIENPFIIVNRLVDIDPYFVLRSHPSRLLNRPSLR